VNTHTTIKGYAGLSRGTPLLPFEYNPSPLAAEQVEIAVNYCDVCPSDISMIEDAWGFSAFPLVPGHEVVGTIAAAGPQVKPCPGRNVHSTAWAVTTASWGNKS
jgi:alcohol/geraniol dehydrogenase (NADP+)